MREVGSETSRPVSRVLFTARSAVRQPFLWDRCRHRPLATYPNGGPEIALEGRPPRRSYSVLLPVGFTVPLLLPEARWALTPPFHPYPARISPLRPRRFRRSEPKYGRGGLLSVALSLGFPPPGVTRHRISVEPGLSSRAAFRHLRARLPGRLVIRIKGFLRQKAMTLKRQPPSEGSAAISRASVSRVDGSATPSTRAGRKWR